MLINNQYCLSDMTMALVAAKHPYYHSIIFDVSGTYLSTQTITSLFETKGIARKKEEILMFDETIAYTYVISPSEELYAFELPKINSGQAMWIFPKYDTEQTFPRLTFTNGERLKIQCSYDQYNWMKKRLNRLSQLEG